jgi:hypothetical protein
MPGSDVAGDKPRRIDCVAQARTPTKPPHPGFATGLGFGQPSGYDGIEQRHHATFGVRAAAIARESARNELPILKEHDHDRLVTGDRACRFGLSDCARRLFPRDAVIHSDYHSPNGGAHFCEDQIDET